MNKPASLIFLTILSGLTCAMGLSGLFDASWFDFAPAGLNLVFRLLVVYVFCYWIIVEVKNSYLEWKYMEDV